MRYQNIRHMPLTLVALLLLSLGAGSPMAYARQTRRVGLVVGFGDGTFVSRCVTFNEKEITGYEALMGSDLEVTASGGAVCRIEETGCPAEECFCALPDYWSYWRLTGGSWQYSGSGARGTIVRDGDVEGWNWGTEPPPILLFRQICFPSTVYLPLLLSVGG
jgi:hypothetical protein